MAMTLAVDTGSTPSLQYGYSDPISGSLLTFMVCPNDSTIDYDSGDAGTVPLVQNLYQGMAQDPVTGLYYGRARWYSPSLGTWISQDPAGYVNGANTYQSVMGNPVRGTDPSGLSPAHCECGPEIGALLEKIRTTVIQKFLGYTRAQQSKFLRDFFWPSNAVADWDITGLADKRVTGWEALSAMDTRIFLYRVWYAWNYGGARNAHVREVWAVAGFENDLSLPASTAGKGCGKSTDRPNKPLAGGAGVGPLRINFSVGP